MDTHTIRLTVLQPSLAPVKLDAKGPVITLGRATECTVPIRDRYLSRHHAEIILDAEQWIVRDCGSVNGTLLNGTRVVGSAPLHRGDRIMLGDSQVIVEAEEISHSQLIALDSNSHAKNLAIPLKEVVEATTRTNVISMLALRFIEDRPMGELFDFILERVIEVLQPSRTAIALLGPDGKSFSNVLLRRADERDSVDLYISLTLLAEVVGERNVVAFVDASMDDRLARAESIIAQNIRSAICAPLVVGDDVLGVLYLDFLANRGTVSHDDVGLVAQIARFAAAKLETTRLREQSVAKQKLDDELRTAYAIQKRLLPTVLPSIDGYSFAAINRPCRTVSGDYYDVVVRQDGRIYFIMADVSGKGITAALVMASVATAFNIFTRTDPHPADLVRELNATLAPKTAPTKFVTMVVGVLDPATGQIEFANAGHVAPLIVSREGVTPHTSTDMVVGLFETATYRNQTARLAPGDALVLFTDGVTEAENDAEDQIGLDPVAQLVGTMHGAQSGSILEAIDRQLLAFAGNAPATDDVTMLALTRLD
jgi:sigma-B regulation protein RsbU (phosphoserine phosphatase)